MRSSDWSSDVCYSDLFLLIYPGFGQHCPDCSQNLKAGLEQSETSGNWGQNDAERFYGKILYVRGWRTSLGSLRGTRRCCLRGNRIPSNRRPQRGARVPAKLMNGEGERKSAVEGKNGGVEGNPW